MAERAVDSLIAAGYASSAISVLLPDTASTKEFAHHKDTKAPEGTAVGGLVFLSGQLAFGSDGKIAAPDIAGQTEQVLANIRSVLGTVGLDLSDVVNATVWLTQGADFPAFNEVYARIFGEHRPARSTVI